MTEPANEPPSAERGSEMELPKLSECRPSVVRMARMMEAQLKRNDHQGGWFSCSKEYLLESIERNLGDLTGSDGHPEYAVKGAAFQRTCADIANFAMMLAENEYLKDCAAQRGEEGSK